jgi:hypothetical protein
MIASIFGACLAIQLLGVAHAANERGPNSRSFAGLLGGALASFVNGGIFCTTAPARVTGEFHSRYLLSYPITIGIGIGVGFIRIGGAHLSLLSVGTIAMIIGYVVCIICLNLPFYVSIEHKQLDRSFGPPLILVAWIFFLWTALYVEVSRLVPHFLVGMLLPLGAWITRLAALFLLSRSCHFKYFVPKARFIESAAVPEAEGKPPPLLGDLEMVYGYMAVLFALMIGCGSYVPMLVEVMNNPTSPAWVTGIVASLVIETMDRTSMTQRLQLRVADYFELHLAAKVIRMSALKLVYYRSQFSTEFAAPIMTLAIGCLRALMLWDSRAVVWLDVNPTVVWVIVSHFLSEMILVEFTVWIAAYKRFAKFVFVTADLPPHHPLGNVALRRLDMKGYIFVSMLGATFLYAEFALYFGAAFVTGTAHDYNKDVSSWLIGGGSSPNFTNHTSTRNYTNFTRRS